MTEEKLKRGFYQLSKSWYANVFLKDNSNLIDDVMIGLFSKDGGTDAEFKVEWTLLADDIAVQLKVFDDAWRILPQFQDLLNWMSSLQREPTPIEFVQKLEKLEIENLTNYQRSR